MTENVIAASALARAIRVPPRRVNELVLGKRAVTADTDLRLARYFRVSEGFFLGLQADYDLMEQRRRMTADGFLATKVTLLGTGQLSAGARIPARMVSATGTAAYVGTAAPRWVPSLLGVLLCGFGIAWLTGGYRLPGPRRRLFALGLSLAGPLLITTGMLAVTW